VPIKIIGVQEQIVERIETDEPDWINEYKREGPEDWFHLLGGNWVRVWSFKLFEEEYQIWIKKQKSQK